MSDQEYINRELEREHAIKQAHRHRVAVDRFYHSFLAFFSRNYNK